MERCRPGAGRGLDAYLVTVADHGLNASTFAARVVASTQAGLTSSVLAALGALKGPLHGGAPGPVLDMLDAIGTRGQGRALDRQRTGRRPPADGLWPPHLPRPRSARRRAWPRDRTAADVRNACDADRLALAAEVETAALAALKRHKPERPLPTNVEFYTALLLEALGFPRDAFTRGVRRRTRWRLDRACARTGGDGQLIRPKSRYVGPVPRQR